MEFDFMEMVKIITSNISRKSRSHWAKNHIRRLLLSIFLGGVSGSFEVTKSRFLHWGLLTNIFQLKFLSCISLHGWLTVLETSGGKTHRRPNLQTSQSRESLDESHSWCWKKARDRKLVRQATGTVAETQILKKCVCPNICVYQPDAASGEKMSTSPPSSAGATQPHSFSQNSLWSGVRRVLSDRLLPEGSKVKQSGFICWKKNRKCGSSICQLFINCDFKLFLDWATCIFILTKFERL